MRRLLVLYGATLTSAVLVALLLPLGVLAQSLAHDRAVEAARQEAQGLAVVANTGAAGKLRDAVDQIDTGPRQTTVFLPDGTAIGPSTQRTPSVELAAQGRAFTASTEGGVEVLLPVGGADGGVTVIRTFVPDVLLKEGVRTAWLTLAGTGALLLLAAVLVGGWIASRLSRSVRDLARVADRVGAGDLTATVTPAGPPEVAAVGRVLNGLGVRITQMLADERELGGDLSHRLRTPVTALRLDVETLQDPAERDRMTEHVDDLVAAIDAAVTAARHPSHVRRPGSCDAAAVVRERSKFWRVLADETHRPLIVDVPAGPMLVPVAAAELGAALDALIDNVFGHTPAPTGFALRVSAAPDRRVLVVVEDDGPGLAAPGLVERGRSGAGSTGIGLDVARRTARQAGGDVLLETSALGGARIVMVFPSL